MTELKHVKSVLNKHKKRDSWFLDDYSVNPYEGCSCNCKYCYVKGSHYGESRIAVKSNALEILERQLHNRAKKKQYGFVAVGSATDAYISHELTYNITRGMLELLLRYKFPVFISTKSALITRDIELFTSIDAAAILPPDLASHPGRGVILAVSVSTMDERISAVLEPGAAPPGQRMDVLRQMKTAGLFAGVNAIPVLPYISDTDEELEKIIATAKNNGADFILTGGLTLFGHQTADSRTLYYKFLERHYPSLIEKYDRLYGENFYTTRDYQQQLKKRADRICAAYHIKNVIV